MTGKYTETRQEQDLDKIPFGSHPLDFIGEDEDEAVRAYESSVADYKADEGNNHD